ncbi:MAG: hypothetical protein KF745_07180 [Phycisphaeraceae bacterium]|nr:hypothetical protein [Phycisphaeraceae bacterium]
MLYDYSRDVENIYRTNPDLRGRFSPTTRLVASEPAGAARDAWMEAPQGSYLRVRDGEIVVRPFKPHLAPLPAGGSAAS